MVGKAKQRLRGIAAPVLPDKPLFVRLCVAFVDNLAMILRGAFILGALALTQQLDTFSEDLALPLADLDPVVEQPVTEFAPVVPTEPEQPVLTDRVTHFLNCTYEAYRKAHYAECVDEPSGIYRPPEADPDDTGSLYWPSPMRVVRHVAPPDADCSDSAVCGLLL
jgi:hypothetical protein